MPKGVTVLYACEQAGVDVPRFATITSCPSRVTARCTWWRWRRARSRWRRAPVMPGMNIKTTTDLVKREGDAIFSSITRWIARFAIGAGVRVAEIRATSSEATARGSPSTSARSRIRSSVAREDVVSLHSARAACDFPRKLRACKAWASPVAAIGSWDASEALDERVEQ